MNTFFGELSTIPRNKTMPYSTTVGKLNNIEDKLPYLFTLLLLFEYQTKMTVNVIKCPFKGMSNVFIIHFINDCFQSINPSSRYANSKATMSFGCVFPRIRPPPQPPPLGLIKKNNTLTEICPSISNTFNHSQGGTELAVARGEP